MKAVSRLGWLAYGLAVAVVIADQLSKHWIVSGSGLLLGQSMPVFGPLQFTWIQNSGVSYGLLQSGAAWSRWGLTAFAFIVAGALIVSARRSEGLITALAMGLIIGGAVGNPIDRIGYGSVIDFIDIQALHFPWIFNLADSAITVGVILWLIESFLPKRVAPANAERL